MCFSVNVNLVKDELERRYDVSFPDYNKYHPSYYYHAFGLPELPAVCSGSPDKISLVRWGLIPYWTKSIDDANKIRYRTFNARAESLATKPSFSSPFKSKRCLIPVKGFFEWQHVGERKIPWYIYYADNEIFSIAGLYERWVETTTGEVFITFSLVTTDANDLMAVIHNSKKRMPVILDRSDEKRWIDQMTPPADALALLRPCPSEVLRAHTISSLVNNKSADRNNPDVIRPFDYGTGSTLC
ncbi:MAG: SOS response-associated peptidase [Bacteroidales bacterium]